MIIKSHVRGGYRQAAAYLKAQGENEKVRVVEISDIEATNLDEAFQNMWALSQDSKVKVPLHHISINPYKGEHVTHDQFMKIIERCEQKYGYKPHDHQRVIVEHVKDGRHHYHVMWNRISLTTGKAVWPGLHWNKSKQAAREMEKELGLRRVVPKRTNRAKASLLRSGRKQKLSGRYQKLAGQSQNESPEVTPTKSGTKSVKATVQINRSAKFVRSYYIPIRLAFYPAMRSVTKRRRRKDENIPDSEKLPFKRPEWESAQIIAWAFENGRADILAQYGFDFSSDIDL